MTSPFPGMDPYLEGDLWRDVHTRLATKISNFLTPLIRPKYVARIEKYVVEDDNSEGNIGSFFMYPDSSVLLNQAVQIGDEPFNTAVSYKPPTPATQSLKMTPPIKVNIPVVEIRDRLGHQLVTAIELLSPVNKRKPGLQPYRQKTQRMYRSGVHLLEIDLLRGGTRPFQHPDLQPSTYLITLHRTNNYQVDIWSIDLKSSLPIVPVPLLVPDADVTIDLQQALKEVYQEAAYDLSIDYSVELPPPALEEADKIWIKELLKDV